MLAGDDFLCLLVMISCLTFCLFLYDCCCSGYFLVYFAVLSSVAILVLFRSAWPFDYLLFFCCSSVVSPVGSLSISCTSFC